MKKLTTLLFIIFVSILILFANNINATYDNEPCDQSTTWVLICREWQLIQFSNIANLCVSWFDTYWLCDYYDNIIRALNQQDYLYQQSLLWDRESFVYIVYDYMQAIKFQKENEKKILDFINNNDNNKSNRWRTRSS